MENKILDFLYQSNLDERSENDTETNITFDAWILTQF